MPITFIPDEENEALKHAPVIMPQADPMAAGAAPGLTPEQQFEQTGAPQPDPVAMPKQPISFEPDPPPTMGSKVWNRFWGTDVDDPMPWTRLATQLAGVLGGATAGGSAGSQMGAGFGPLGQGAGGVIGALLGGVAGVTAGSAAPEVAMELGEAGGILAPGFREQHGLSDTEMRTLLEGELLLELATGGGISAARGVGRAVTKGLTGASSKGAMGASEFGVDLMPVQLGRGKVPRAFVNVMGQFPWVGTPIRKQGALIEDQVKYAISKLPSRIAPAFSSPAIGKQIIDDVATMTKRVDDYFGQAYKALDTAADAAGIAVQPNLLLQRADDTLQAIGVKTPVQPGKPVSTATRALEDVKSFVNSEIMTLRSNLGGVGSPMIAEQSVAQIRGLSDKINEKISSLVKEGVPYKSRPVELLTSLRQAAQLDMLNNAVGADPAVAKRIMADYKELNTHFSETISELFESAGAKRIKAVNTAGARGTGGKNTKVPVDNLMRIVLRDESPQILKDVRKLVTQETFDNMAAHVISTKLSAATRVQGTENMLNVDAFAKLLGLNDKTSQRFAQTKTLLDMTGGLKMPEVEKMIDTLRAVEDVPIPNMSQFVARRATLGGFRSVKNAILPGALLAGGAGGASAAGLSGAGLGTIMTGIMVIGGGRMFSKMISNPDNAKPLGYVLKNEMNRYAWRRSVHMALRGTMQQMVQDGEMGMEEFARMSRDANIFVDEVINDTLEYKEQNK